MPDFSALLSKPVDDIKKPKPNPVGTYEGVTTKYTLDEANTKEGPKPICRFDVRLTSPRDDVDAEELQAALDGRGLGDGTYKFDFWLTPEAQYRVVECAKSMGIETEGKTLGALIPEMVNQPVLVFGKQVQSTKKGREEDIFFNLDSLTGMANG